MKIKFDDKGNCLVYFGFRKKIEFPTVYSFGFNRQYETPLSADNKYLFIGNWERGLFCYDVESGRLKWKEGPGKVRNIFVMPDCLIVEMCDRGVYRRNLKAGKIEKILKMSGINEMFRISNNEIFAGPKRDKYFLIGIPDLKIKKEFHRNEIDPDNCFTLFIDKIVKKGSKLVVSGRKRHLYPTRVFNSSQALNAHMRWHKKAREDDLIHFKSILKI